MLRGKRGTNTLRLAFERSAELAKLFGHDRTWFNFLVPRSRSYATRSMRHRCSFMRPRYLPILLCSATSPFWGSPFWRKFCGFWGKMQYLRRDKKDEEDGKWSICVLIHFLRTLCKKFHHDPSLLLILGAQSNPFQNLDKSAVLQEVGLEFLYFCLS